MQLSRLLGISSDATSSFTKYFTFHLLLLFDRIKGDLKVRKTLGLADVTQETWQRKMERKPMSRDYPLRWNQIQLGGLIWPSTKENSEFKSLEEGDKGQSWLKKKKKKRIIQVLYIRASNRRTYFSAEREIREDRYE